MTPLVPLVQSMHDTRTLRVTAWVELIEQRVDQRAIPMSLRMNHESGGLVDDDERVASRRIGTGMS